MMTRFISVFAAFVVFVTTYALVLPAITMEREADCGIEAHQHDDSCFEQQLICDLAESPGHQHDDSCYRAESVLKCVAAEHTHSEDCYGEEENLICEEPEHVHDETCYEEVRELVCELEESAGHQHDASCYENVLVCGKEVHVHSEECYHQDPVEEEMEYSEENDIPEEERYLEEYAVPEEEQVQPGDVPVDRPDEDTAQVPADADPYDPGGSSGTGEDAAAAPQDGEGASGRTGDNTVQEAGTEVFIPETEVPLAASLVPELESLDFRTLLNSHTGIYYYHVQPDEVVENSAQIADWKKVTADTELGENDLLRVYLAYTLPAGAVNTTNEIVRYRLPGNLHLSDDQVKAINGTENGIAAQYVDYSTLTITDLDNYHKYLGAEAVEGTRTPDQDQEAYLAAGGANGNGEEYISAVVRVENIYDSHSGALSGQDLVFTFVPYTVFKNRHEYGSDGQQTKTGLKVRGWFSLDFNMSQVDFEEPSMDGNREILFAGVVFAGEDRAAQIEEIRTDLHLVRPAETGIGAEADPEAGEAAEAEDPEAVADSMQEAENAEDAENAENSENTEAAHDGSEAEEGTEEATKDPENEEGKKEEDEEKLIKLFDEDPAEGDQKDSEEDSSKDANADSEKDAEKDSEKDSEKDAPAVIMPAMSFEDSIRVSTGRPAGAETKGAGGTVADAADALPKKAKVTVRVEADEGTFPAGTTMVLAAVKDLETIAETVQDTVENGSAAGTDSGTTDSTGNKAAGTGNPRTYGFQAVDISFHDADGNEIEPAKPVRVAMTSEIVDQVRQEQQEDPGTAVADPMVVHIDDNGNVETMDLIAPEEIEPAQGRTEEELREEAEAEAAARRAEEEKEAGAAKGTEEETGKGSEEETEQAGSPASADGGKLNAEETAGPAENDIEKDGSAGPAEDEEKAGSAGETDPGEEKTGQEREDTEEQAEHAADEADPQDVEKPLTVSFKTDSFSVYVIVYTVDFHWKVNGKLYEFSIPGGGFVSLEHLVEVLGIARIGENDASEGENEVVEGENAPENDVYNVGEENGVEENDSNTGSSYEESISLNNVEVSEATKQFVADVVSVEFSSPELVWVGKVDAETTVGRLKEANGLEVQYSAELTEEQIAEINSSTVEAGDWALISVLPFTSEESLTVTMKNGDQFVVKVTDYQISKDFITAAGEKYEIIVTYDESAEIPEEATLELTEFAEGSEEYQAARGTVIGQRQEEIPGFDESGIRIEAFDLSILDKDGNQVEPKSAVHVSMKIKSIPEETVKAEAQGSIVIHHFDESTGDVIAETVASAVSGNIQIEEKSAQAEFQLESFSTFTISWAENTNETSTTARWIFDNGNGSWVYINVYYVDESGNAIRRPENLGGVDGWQQGNNGWLVNHSLGDNGDHEVTLNIQSVLAKDIPGRTFLRAYINPNGNQIDVASVIGRRNTNWGNYNSATYFNDEQTGFVYQNENRNGQVQGASIYLVYSGGPHTTVHYGYMEGDTFVEFNEQPSPTDTSTSFGWAHLIYDFTDTDDLGLQVAWKYKNTYYWTSETTNPAGQGGTEMQPILRYYNNSWRYYNGNISNQNDTRNNNNWKAVADGSDIYVVYEKPEIPMGGSPTLTANGHEPDDPYILKESVENGDGTNTLSLSVTGSTAPMEAEKIADVIVILDLSSSMRRDIGSNTAYDSNYQTVTNSRYYQAKQAVQKLADTLYGLNGTDGEKYRLGLITFSNKATIRQYPTDNKQTFQSVLDGITAYEGSGTNWEHSLQLANEMSVSSDRSTYIVFITDGEPSVRQTRGDLTNEQLSGNNVAGQVGNPNYNPVQEGDIFHGGLSGGRFFERNGDYSTPDFRDYLGSATFGGLMNNPVWDARNRNAAVDEIASIVGHNKGFYAIGVSSDVNYLGDVVEAGGVDSDHYQLVSSPTAFEGVINSILDELTDLDGKSGQADVRIYDGITDLTQTISKVNQEEHRLIGADGNFKYYKSTAPAGWSTWTAAQKAAYALGTEYANTSETPDEYSSFSPDELAAYDLGKNISFTEWTTREADGCAAAVYNTETGAVEWNMGQTFMLEDGVTYKVSFICWPSQEAYDIIAKLNNATITFGDTTLYPQEVWDQFEGDATNGYTLKTNEEGANTKYKTATKINDTVTTSGNPLTLLFGEVPNLNLSEQKIYIHKDWKNSLDEESEDSVNLGVIADGNEDDLYKIIIVGENQDPNLNWRGSAYVSTGLLKIESGQMVLYENGHDFTVTENVEGGPNYNWDLTTDTYRPMVITDSSKGFNSPTTVILKKVKSTDDYDYQIGSAYYAIVTDSNNALNAVNHRRSHVEIMKNVEGNNAPEKDRFTIDVGITDSKEELGDPDNKDSDAWVWFSIYDNDGEIVNVVSLDGINFVTADNLWYELINNGEKSTVDEINESNIAFFSGFCCVPSGTTITAQLPKGYKLDVINLPIDSVCTISEPTNGLPVGYSIEGVVETREYHDDEDDEDKEEQIQTVNTNAITATIGYNESTYKVTVNNKWNTIDVQLKKVKEDKTTTLSGSTFELTRYSNGTWTDNVLSDITPGAPAIGEAPAVSNPVSFGGLGIGKYKLTEVDPPDGYVILKKNVYFEVYKQNNSSVLSVRLIDENGDPLTNEEIEALASSATLDSSVSGTNTIYILKIINEPGAALPHTGGPGTNLIYLFGIMLTGLAGAGLVMKRRRRKVV